MLDSKGIVSTDRTDLNEFKADMAERSNPRPHRRCRRALNGADAFLGVSAGTIPEGTSRR